jgi:hypothetical protein
MAFTGQNWYMYCVILFVNWQEVPTQQMKTHVVEAHKMHEYRFQCDQCPKRFNKRADIRNHYRYDKKHLVMRVVAGGE